MECLPEECVVHALGFLDVADAIRYTRTTKGSSTFAAKHDRNIFGPALQRLQRWRQGSAPVMAMATDVTSWRDRFLHERDDLKRTAITQDDLTGHVWRLRFREPGNTGPAPREVPPPAALFIPNGQFLTEGYPPLPWSIAPDSGAVVIANFPPHRAQRRAHYDHGWTLENDNVMLWTVDESGPIGEFSTSLDLRPGSSGDRHARRAGLALLRGAAFARVGRRGSARVAFADAVAHAGGTQARLPVGSSGHVSEEESNCERYRADPGGLLVEIGELYQLETLWTERDVRTRALIALANSSLEAGEARQALDAARRASVSVVQHGARAIQAVEALRARALKAVAESEQPLLLEIDRGQRDVPASPCSTVARGLACLGV